MATKEKDIETMGAPPLDPTLADLQRHRAATRADAAAQVAALLRPIEPERQAGLVAAGWLEAFAAERGPIWRAIRAELREPEHRAPVAERPVAQKLTGARTGLLEMIQHLEAHCRNAVAVRWHVAHLAALQLEDLHGDPFLTSPLARARQVFRDAAQSVRELEGAWAPFEARWREYVALRLAQPPRAQPLGREVAETRPTPEPRRAVSALSGDEP